MDCPKTTMVLSVGWPAVWAFSGATFSAVTPAPTTKTASSKTNLDTVTPYFRSLRMFPPATSAPSLTHARPENHSPPCSLLGLLGENTLGRHRRSEHAVPAVSVPYSPVFIPPS